MKLIATRLGPAAKVDRLQLRRDDGTESSIDMPRQGVLPHDLVHFVVESMLGFRHGFLGLVASGADPRFVMERVHGPGCAEVEREAAQAEAVVEALQTQLWAGGFDDAAFDYGVVTACASRGVGAPAPAGGRCGEALFHQAQALYRRWMAVPPHGSLTLDFLPLQAGVAIGGAGAATAVDVCGRSS